MKTIPKIMRKILRRTITRSGSMLLLLPFLLLIAPTLLIAPNAMGHPKQHLLLADLTGLPELGDPSYATMSLAKEKKIGRVLLAKLRGRLPLVRQIELQSYLNSVGYRVLSYGANSPIDFYFLLADDDSINAFAAPGGIIAVNTGLLVQADSEDEVAGVIAHEIAHIEQRHIARLYALSDQTQWLNTLQLIASIITAAYNPKLGQLGVTAAASSPIEQCFAHSRVFEKEADYSGMKLLYNAGYAPQGMVSFFAKLQAQGSRSNRIPEFLRTHPLDINRLNDMQQRAQQYPRRATQASQDFVYVKAALQALSETKTNTPDEEPHITLYRQAIRAMEKGFSFEAVQALNRIKAPYRDNKMVGIALAKALMLQNKNKQAEQVLRKLRYQYSESVSIPYYLAKLLLRTQRPQQAKDLLKSVAAQQRLYPQLIKLKAETEAALKKKPLNHEYLSDYYYAMGKINLALEQLKLADAAVRNNPVAKKRIKEKRKRVLRLKEEMEE